MNLSNIYTQTIETQWLTNNQVSLDVLRLDLIDQFVSGNKWFKLKYYLLEAMEHKKLRIATFGGPWSNHILASAFAAEKAGLASIGFIRGEKPVRFSETLNLAEGVGMDLRFVTRNQYRRKEEISAMYANDDIYWIPEGGYGPLGAKGAAEILATTDVTKYSHIIGAVGTGTMLAGILMVGCEHQTIIGISSMKGNFSLEEKIRTLTASQQVKASLLLFHDYHFGGYGKHPKTLIDTLNDVYRNLRLPLDIVYTGKTYYALKDLTEKKFFEPGSRLLMIHSGGLNGNRSLPEQVLVF